VQNLPRLATLLQDLYDLTRHGHPDQPALSAVLAATQSASRHCSMALADHEARMQLSALQAALVLPPGFELSVAGRRLLLDAPAGFAVVATDTMAGGGGAADIGGLCRPLLLSDGLLLCVPDGARWTAVWWLPLETCAVLAAGPELELHGPAVLCVPSPRPPPPGRLALSMRLAVGAGAEAAAAWAAAARAAAVACLARADSSALRATACVRDGMAHARHLADLLRAAGHEQHDAI
jgi:hypothetical protein